MWGGGFEEERRRVMSREWRGVGNLREGGVWGLCGLCCFVLFCFVLFCPFFFSFLFVCIFFSSFTLNAHGV